MRTKKVDLAIACLGLALILIVGLYPFKLLVGGFSAEAVLRALPLKEGTESGWEILTNALLFTPFAFGVARCLKQKPRSVVVFSAVLITGATLSYAIEFLQFFLPGRFPSRLDLFSNSLGAILGFGCSYAGEQRLRSSPPGGVFHHIPLDRRAEADKEPAS